MTNFQSKLKSFRDALVEGLTEYSESDEDGVLACDIYHYWRPKMTAPYVVWAEDGEPTSFHADDRKKEQAISGYIDFYTRTEFDPIADKIQDVLYAYQENTFVWRFDSAQYEDETNLIHFQWTWEMS